MSRLEGQVAPVTGSSRGGLAGDDRRQPAGHLPDPEELPAGMKERGRGSIITMASSAGRQPDGRHRRRGDGLTPPSEPGEPIGRANNLTSRTPRETGMSYPQQRYRPTPEPEGTPTIRMSFITGTSGGAT